jgi:hypothetical protein
MHKALQRLSKQCILDSLHHIPSYVRPPYNSRSIRSCSSALSDHIQKRIAHLSSLPARAFFWLYFSIVPFQSWSESSRCILIQKILVHEYGDEIVLCLSNPISSRNAKQKVQRREEKLHFAEEAIAWEREVAEKWPTVVDDHTVFQCLEDYWLGSIWEPPPVCCVCGLERRDTVDVEVSSVRGSPLNFYPLHVSDSFITDHTDFQYGVDAIDGAILESKGFKDYNEDGVVMQICGECHSALKKEKVLRLALANRLY